MKMKVIDASLQKPSKLLAPGDIFTYDKPFENDKRFRMLVERSKSNNEYFVIDVEKGTVTNVGTLDYFQQFYPKQKGFRLIDDSELMIKSYY
jgi:hypothetical protein